MVKRIITRRAGGSISATLPKDMMDRLNIGPGDELFAIETERGILLTPFDPDFERAMQVYERGAKKYRNALRELAH
jgi:putative addiction module antidote